MSQDELRQVAIAHVTLRDEDRDAVTRAITKAIGKTVAGSNGHLVVRAHPDAWKRFMEWICAGVYPLPREAQEAVHYRCNADQDPGVLSISFSEVKGDRPCY